jgi:hypothetical protein
MNADDLCTSNSVPAYHTVSTFSPYLVSRTVVCLLQVP